MTNKQTMHAMNKTPERALIPMPPSQGVPLFEGSEGKSFLRDLKNSSVDYHLLLRKTTLREETFRRFGVDDDQTVTCFLCLERTPNPGGEFRVSFYLIVRAAEHLCGNSALDLKRLVVG